MKVKILVDDEAIAQFYIEGGLSKKEQDELCNDFQTRLEVIKAKVKQEPPLYLTLYLPWPPMILNPNKRSHWRKKNPIKADYREVCRAIAEMHQGLVFTSDIAMSVTFHAPDRRKRDLDNLLAACKAGFDGMSKALSIDDSRLRPITVQRGEKVAGGRVAINLMGYGYGEH